MSTKRMTDDRWAYLRKFGTLGPNVYREARDELDRARSEEARLLEEAKQKDASIAALEEQQRALILRTHSQDATIAALANALRAMRAAFPRAYASQEDADAADAADTALRLAGRLT